MAKLEVHIVANIWSEKTSTFHLPDLYALYYYLIQLASPHIHSVAKIFDKKIGTSNRQSLDIYYI